MRNRLPNFTTPLRNLGKSEFNALLDLFSTAMFLVDIRNQRILTVNSKATKLTAFTREELTKMNFNELWANPDELALIEKEADNDQPKSFTLIKRNTSKIDVQVTVKELSPSRKWTLIEVKPAHTHEVRGIDRRNQSHIWESYRTLIQASQQLDLDSSIKGVLRAGQVLTGASVMSIYQADIKSLQLRNIAHQGLTLPANLPSQDLTTLRIPQVWTPTERPSCSLQRAAQSNNLTYLANMPLGQPNALIGLMVIGDTQSPPTENILPMLQILADTVTSIIQNHTLTTNLRQDLSEQLHELLIHETIQDATQDCVVILSPKLIIKTLNKSAEMTLGYANHEVRGQSVDNILIGTETLIPALKHAQQGLPTINQENIRLYRRSGQAFLAQVSTLPVLDGSKLEGVIILIRDLSEQEQIQIHAQQLEHRAYLGEVTASFAHEVLNPINNISTGLQLMERNLAPDDPNQEIITRLLHDCVRLEELVRSVLSTSRPNEYEMESVDLTVLIDRLLKRFQHKIARINVQSHFQVDSETPLIEGNPHALEQIFTNLIDNALQAMPKAGGNLAVKISPVRTPGSREYVEVIIADSGTGIPEELIERIFQPFFTTRTKGTGLGLAITKRIVTAHKGTIKVSSFPGGTIFQVHLPSMVQPSAEKVPAAELAPTIDRVSIEPHSPN